MLGVKYCASTGLPQRILKSNPFLQDFYVSSLEKIANP